MKFLFYVTYHSSHATFLIHSFHLPSSSQHNFKKIFPLIGIPSQIPSWFPLHLPVSLCLGILFFFIYFDSLCNLIQSCVFKYHLYAEDFQTCISRPNPTLEPQAHICNCLPAISIWMANGHLILNISYTEILFYLFWLISILIAAFLFWLIRKAANCFRLLKLEL